MAAQLVQGAGNLGALGGNSIVQDARPLLLVTTVDIGAGRSDRLEIRRGDDPAEVAAAFAAKHNLPTAVIPRLAAHLRDNVAKVEDLAMARQSPEPEFVDDRLQPGQKAPQEMSEGGYEELAVFNRLYEQALVLRQKLDSKRDRLKKNELEALKQNKASMSWISAEMMRERGSGPFSSYGEMLYQESLESLARKREKAERCKQEQVKQEIAEASFHPEITRLAQKMWGPHQHGSAPAWQRLSKGKVTKAQQRLENLRREKQEAEMRECTFKPQLSEHSERIVVERSQAMRSPHLSAHQQLYHDAIRRQQKQQEYRQWRSEEETFQPKLIESTLSKEFLRRSLHKEGSSGLPGDHGMPVVDRLYASYEKLQSKLAEARSSLTRAVDPVTGKRLFHPATGRAPTTIIRHGAGQAVCQKLYKLKQQQDEKVRAAAEAVELKRQEVMTSSKASQGSKQLLKQLQQRRFKQIFEFLDQDGLGSFNLVSLIMQQPEWLNELNDEVRADLELAAKLLSKRSLKRNDSNNSDTSSASFFMPPPPAMGMESGDGQAGAAAGSGPGRTSTSSAPGSPSHPGVVTLTLFCTLMEEALALRRGPRTYLAPSPPRKYVPPETYKPQIDEHSKQLAAKKRPKDKPYFESLYEEGSAISQKLHKKREEAEAQRVSACTFAPRLVSKQLVKEGTVMKRVREGTFYKPSGADLGDEMANIIDDPDSLQQLAASVMGVQQAGQGTGASRGQSTAAAAAGERGQAASAQQMQEGLCSSIAAHGLEDEESVSHVLRQLQLECEPSSNSSSGDEVAHKRQQQRELEDLDLRLQAALEQQRQVKAELHRHQNWQQLAAAPGEQGTDALKQQQQQSRQHADEEGTKASWPNGAAAVAEDDQQFEGSDEHRQYLELEHEVQQMLEATSAAAAAAERMRSRTDQQYLSQILGLAQEQVDAMAPAISKLHALQLQHPHPASTTASIAATPLASAAGTLALSEALLQKHPATSGNTNTLRESTAKAVAAAEESCGIAGGSSCNIADTKQYKQHALEGLEEEPLASNSTYLPAGTAAAQDAIKLPVDGNTWMTGACQPPVLTDRQLGGDTSSRHAIEQWVQEQEQ